VVNDEVLTSAEEDKCRKAFATADKNGNGTISPLDGAHGMHD
jgi:hypothetical protein